MTTTTASETTTSSHGLGFVKITGWIVAVVGAIMLVAGGVTWFVVQDQLAAENITVAEDASFLAGNDVNGPLSAYAQADIINKHALEASGGKTYAELDREDPVRATVMNGSFLRASLFTSVIAFGVAAMAVGTGLVVALLGWGLRIVAVRPEPLRV
jgi:hypothetical protein